MKNTITFLVLAIMWVPPALAIAANQKNPDIGTALGVPYAFLGGLSLAAIATLVLTLCSIRWPSLRPRYGILAVSGVVAIILLVVANQGLLSATVPG